MRALQKHRVKVVRNAGKWIDVTFSDDSGMSTAMEWKDAYGPRPEIGEEFIYIGEGFGGSTRGFNRLDGTVLYFHTDEDMERIRQKELDKYRRQEERTYQKNHVKWRAEVDGLDEPFKVRMSRFIREAGFKAFFTSGGGAYELFTVSQANGLYREYMTTGEPHYTFWDKAKKDEHAGKWFTGFYAMSFDQQKRVFSGLDDGHSGNTHGFMVSLARNVAQGVGI